MQVMLTQITVTALIITMGVCNCQDCSYPTNEDLEDVIKELVPSADSPMTPNVNVMGFNPVCLAVSDEKDLYRHVSAVVEYTCSGNSNCPTGRSEEQIESECNIGVWSTNVLGFTEHTHSVTTNASLSTMTREDCAFCLSLELATRLSLTADDVTHCVG